MRRVEFLNQLKEQLYGLPVEDLNRSLGYYDEMILDRMEDGLTEEEAVTAVGTVDEVTKAILSATPIRTLIKRNVKSKTLSKKEIILLSIFSPIIISLFISLIAIVISLFATLFAFVMA